MSTPPVVGVNLHNHSADSLVSEISASWFDPQQAGHGFVMEVIDSPSGPTLLVYWFVWLDEQPVWMVGIGLIQDQQTMVDFLFVSGTEFPPNFDPEAVLIESWGSATFVFESEDSASASWTTSFPGFSRGMNHHVNATEHTIPGRH